MSLCFWAICDSSLGNSVFNLSALRSWQACFSSIGSESSELCNSYCVFCPWEILEHCSVLLSWAKGTPSWFSSPWDKATSTYPEILMAFSNLKILLILRLIWILKNQHASVPTPTWTLFAGMYNCSWRHGCGPWNGASTVGPVTCHMPHCMTLRKMLLSKCG